MATTNLVKPGISRAGADLDTMMNNKELYLREYAAGGVQNRNRFMTLADEDRTRRDKEFAEAGNVDCYQGMFAKSYGRYVGDLVFDLDMPGFLESDAAFKALQEELAALDRILTECLGIPKEAISCEFSGAKGFHVIIAGSIRLFAKNQPAEYKKIAMALKHWCPSLDTSIYDERRLLRIRNSINSKTGLYDIAVPLRYAEVAGREHLIMMAGKKEGYRHRSKPLNAEQRKEVLKHIEELLTCCEKEFNVNEVRNNEPAIIDLENVDIKSTMTYEEAKAYIKAEIDMRELVGQRSQYFNCVFHNDTTKSASIMPPTDAHPFWTYHCFSDNCEHDNIDNVKVVQELYGLDYSEAFNWLCRYAGISYRGSKDIKRVKEKNYRAINNSCINKRFYERTLKPVYQGLCSIAVKAAEKQQMSGAGEDFICITSLRYVAAAVHTTVAEVCRKMALLAALGFIKKYRDDEVPENLRGEFFDLCEARYGKDRTPQFWSITNLADKKNLDYVLKMTRHWLKSGAKIRSISYEYIKEVFGFKIADRAYTKPAALPRFRYEIEEAVA